MYTQTPWAQTNKVSSLLIYHETAQYKSDRDARRKLFKILSDLITVLSDCI